MKVQFAVASVIGLAATSCNELVVRARYDSGPNVVVTPTRAADETRLANDEHAQNGQISDGVLLAQATGTGSTGGGTSSGSQGGGTGSMRGSGGGTGARGGTGGGTGTRGTGGGTGGGM